MSLSESIQFRMHERDARALREAARASGVPLSALLRALAREAFLQAGKLSLPMGTRGRLHVGPPVPLDARGARKDR
jgi:hypothetical protein